jgi:hypothetical protein
LDRDPAAEILSGHGRGLTGAYRFDPGVRLIWAMDLESGGPGQARATGGGAQPAATRARWRYGGERRRSGGFGARVHCSLRGLHQDVQRRTANTTTTPRAAKMVRDGGRRRSAAAELRRRSPSVAVHEYDSNQHRRLPFLAAQKQRRSLDDGRRRGSVQRRRLDKDGGGALGLASAAA